MKIRISVRIRDNNELNNSRNIRSFNLNYFQDELQAARRPCASVGFSPLLFS